MAKDLSRNEAIKEASAYLRGTLAEGVADEITGAISDDDQQLVKFHGMYLQDDRDLRAERSKKKMEKAFAFMLRVRIPGGTLTPAQWLALDEVARLYGNRTLRVTTRQAVQLHGVIKSNLKATLKEIDQVLLDTSASLPASEVDTVVFIVSSAVQGLDAKNVTVADTSGTVLSAPGSAGSGAQGDLQTRQRQDLEATLTSDVQRLVSSATGKPGG